MISLTKNPRPAHKAHKRLSTNENIEICVIDAMDNYRRIFILQLQKLGASVTEIHRDLDFSMDDTFLSEKDFDLFVIDPYFGLGRSKDGIEAAIRLSLKFPRAMILFLSNSSKVTQTDMRLIREYTRADKNKLLQLSKSRPYNDANLIFNDMKILKGLQPPDPSRISYGIDELLDDIDLKDFKINRSEAEIKEITEEIQTRIKNYEKELKALDSMNFFQRFLYKRKTGDDPKLEASILWLHIELAKDHLKKFIK